MAEKHKSKYKKPETTKYKSRTDLKDYTIDDKKGGLNPFSTGEKQSNVLRKTDKEFIDTGDLFVKYNADDRLYKDLEDGEYDPKHAAKVLKKRQDTDEKDNVKNIKDKIENLTREQKEQLVKHYVSNMIRKVLLEQPTAPDTAEDPAETDPTATAPDPTATPTPDATATPTPDATATPTPDAATPDATTTPTPDATAPATTDLATQQTPAEQFGTELQKSQNNFERIGKIKEAIGISLDTVIENSDKQSLAEFYQLLIHDLIKQKKTLFMKIKNNQQNNNQ